MQRCCWLFAALLALGPSLPIEAETAIRWQPHTAAAFDGSPLAGEIGRIFVPADRRQPAGPSIELAFVRWRTTHPDPRPPIFFLAGGPGASGVVYGATTATHPQIRLLEHSDVIAIDQRGTGDSRPNLMEPECTAVLPRERAIDRAEMIAGLERALRRCAGDWRRQGLEPQGYNTLESADDVDAVRRALGLDKIVLFGTSYGSHLGLAYLRRHGQHVARAVLSKVEGPDQTFKLPSTVQRHLETLSARIAADPRLGTRFPNLVASVRELLAKLDRRPATIEHGGERVTVGAFDLQVWLARSLATSTEMAAIPAALERFERGDWSALAPTALDNRRPGLPPMALLMDCASGASRARRAEIERETADPANLLGDALAAPLYPELCRAAGARELDEGFRAPFLSEVPVLFVSGTLDVRTPPSNVEEILAGFTHGTHVVVRNAGHEARELMSEEYRNLLQAFLRGERVESCTITLPAVRFSGVPVEPSS